RQYREGVRRYYRQHYPLTPQARANPALNPGLGSVSRVCHEFRVGLAVIDQMLAYARAAGLVEVLLRRKPVAVEMDGDRVRAVRLRHLESGDE
ncbi:MAG: FAD-dependent oxidoreductase, partial [Chloroflexota bacterium]